MKLVVSALASTGVLRVGLGILTPGTRLLTRNQWRGGCPGFSISLEFKSLRHPPILAGRVPLSLIGGSDLPSSTDQETKDMKSMIRALLVAGAVTLAFSTWTFAADSGAELYKSKCASCHGAEGKGDTGPGKAMKVKDLSSEEVQKQSDADLTGIVEKGKKPMPGYEGKLTKEQVADVVKYLRELKK
jgi:cytochrome c6